MRRFHKGLTAAALAALLGPLGACGGASRASLLRDKLRAGCQTHGECSMLWAEARAREQECRHERRRDCSEEAENLRVAEGLLQPHEAQAQAKLAREREERAARQRAERERQARERETLESEAPKARRPSEEPQVREDLLLAAQREEEERRAAEEAAAKEAVRRAQRAMVYEAMSPDERARYLRACFGAGSEVLHPDITRLEIEGKTRLPCDVLLTHLIAAAPSESEREALLQELEARVSARKEPEVQKTTSREPVSSGSSGSSSSSGASSGRSSPSRAAGRTSGGGRARCCDGTLSKKCGCGGGKGCCSRHGGVCGCGD